MAYYFSNSNDESIYSLNECALYAGCSDSTLYFDFSDIEDMVTYYHQNYYVLPQNVLKILSPLGNEQTIKETILEKRMFLIYILKDDILF